jgi:hypothetical protein
VGLAGFFAVRQRVCRADADQHAQNRARRNDEAPAPSRLRPTKSVFHNPMHYRDPAAPGGRRSGQSGDLDEESLDSGHQPMPRTSMIARRASVSSLEERLNDYVLQLDHSDATSSTDADADCYFINDPPLLDSDGDLSDDVAGWENVWINDDGKMTRD